MYKITDASAGEIHEVNSKRDAMHTMRMLIEEGHNFTVEQSFALRVEILDSDTGKTEYAYFDTFKQAKQFVLRCMYAGDTREFDIQKNR